MRFLLTLLLLIAPLSYAGTCKIIRVVDGDTVEVPLSCLPKNMKLFVRVHGVDLTKSLIDNGLARPYSGGKKVTWCEEQ